MARLLKINFWRTLPAVVLSRTLVTLTQQEVATALRPLYFAVHPDLFYRFPKEKEINENSLKQMNYYLETILENKSTDPVLLTFCLKNGTQNVDHSTSFKHVNIQLLGKDIHSLLYNILSTCHLSTDYLDDLQKSRPRQMKPKQFTTRTSSKSFHDQWWKEVRKTAEDIERCIWNEPDVDFRSWLINNTDKALHRLQMCQPLREETERLRNELREVHFLKDIVWNCGWGITHFRGCLQSFQRLLQQHPSQILPLKGRTLVFGRETGVSFEGHIILSSEDVRNNWLDVIQSVEQYDNLLRQIPKAEGALSEVLRGISVDHRKFQPTVMVQKYIQQLGKLTSALYKHRWVHGYPEDWPRRLCAFQLVVECESGPLMLSPTGQFIVPASCPALVLVDFIGKNMAEADQRLQFYSTMKKEERMLHAQCMAQLGLSALEKDDNITPDLMVQCCRRILRDAAALGPSLRGLRLRISHYYSVLQDGEICIPWNWNVTRR
ncbi:T-cell activation inhibitor, mitochondrial-like isoform X1 [Argiope bruennichi]|uniref:T-cell activation inhibitor, mitochondrial-like isoform X1 n=2 Tax=Argiope bruennichi TaxID=94029 RepID=UPI002494E341|nr:T-cell activation inhibitor, mitochondrial-like isoform X1 [Argiope bruennichi]